MDDKRNQCSVCPQIATWQVKLEASQTDRLLCGACLATLIGTAALTEITKWPPLRGKKPGT